MEEALNQAEETKVKLKETVAILGDTVDALEGAVNAVSDTSQTKYILTSHGLLGLAYFKHLFNLHDMLGDQFKAYKVALSLSLIARC